MQRLIPFCTRPLFIPMFSRTLLPVLQKNGKHCNKKGVWVRSEWRLNMDLASYKIIAVMITRFAFWSFSDHFLIFWVVIIRGCTIGCHLCNFKQNEHFSICLHFWVFNFHIKIFVKFLKTLRREECNLLKNCTMTLAPWIFPWSFIESFSVEFSGKHLPVHSQH